MIKISGVIIKLIDRTEIILYRDVLSEEDTNVEETNKKVLNKVLEEIIEFERNGKIKVSFLKPKIIDNLPLICLEESEELEISPEIFIKMIESIFKEEGLQEDLERVIIQIDKKKKKILVLPDFSITLIDDSLEKPFNILNKIIDNNN